LKPSVLALAMLLAVTPIRLFKAVIAVMLLLIEPIIAEPFDIYSRVLRQTRLILL
jgi:hypothetical protein